MAGCEAAHQRKIFSACEDPATLFRIAGSWATTASPATPLSDGLPPGRVFRGDCRARRPWHLPSSLGCGHRGAARYFFPGLGGGSVEAGSARAVGSDGCVARALGFQLAAGIQAAGLGLGCRDIHCRGLLANTATLSTGVVGRDTPLISIDRVAQQVLPRFDHHLGPHRLAGGLHDAIRRDRRTGAGRRRPGPGGSRRWGRIGFASSDDAV